MEGILKNYSFNLEFGRSKTGVGDLSETEQFFSSDIGNASILGKSFLKYFG